MKFTDGMWMTRAGYTVESPGEIYEVQADGEGLTLFCPYVAVQHRGNTLDGGLLTVRITAGRKGYDAAIPVGSRHGQARDGRSGRLLVPAQRRAGGARVCREKLAD